MKERAFDHVLIIMFENQYRGYVMQNQYMHNLAAQGIELTNCFGVMHPSQTNYIASIAGELCGITDDKKPEAPLTQATIVDLIEDSPYHLRWKAYMESYIVDDTPWQAENFSPKDHYPYVIKHNPFSSFKHILENRQRWQNIDNEAGFYRDLLNNTLPEYAWFTPNMWSDGHYLTGSLNNDLNGERAPILVDQQADWLKSFFTNLNFPGPNAKLPAKTLVVVTYDEADFEAYYDRGKKYTYDGPNQIYTLLLGDMITPGQQHQGYNHYSLLKTIEKNFNLGDLKKNDRDANWFQFLWNKKFHWQASNETPLSKQKTIKAANYQQQLYIVSVNHEDQLYFRTFNGTHWSGEFKLADNCTQQLSLAANNDKLLLAYRNKEHRLILMHYDLNNGWRHDESPVNEPIEQLDLVAIPHQQKFLLVYQNTQGQMFSISHANDTWQQTPVALQLSCDEHFCLAALGPTILLIYKMMNSHKLACLSYNCADYNKITVADSEYAGTYDDTSIHKWSTNAFSLNHFSEAANIITPHEDEPVTEGANSAGIIAADTLDGVLHLLYNSPGNNQLLTQTFSISGTLTPNLPVSYDAAKNDTTSNGYGTLAEAGWSAKTAINGIFRDANQTLAIATLEKQLWIFYQPLEQDNICACRGLYKTNKE